MLSFKKAAFHCNFPSCFLFFRIHKLTRLQRQIVYGGEPLQVNWTVYLQSFLKASPLKVIIVPSVRCLDIFSLCFKVVKYGPYGHYHAHYDSSRKSDYPEGTKCCHYDMENAPMAKCRICRCVEGQSSKFNEQYLPAILAPHWSPLTFFQLSEW